MTPRRPGGPVVIDTDVYGANLVPGSALWARYESIVTGRPAFISFQTEAELHFGAMRAGWCDARRQKLDARIAEAEAVYPGPELVMVYARLRVDCEHIGHALSQRDHDADRWIAATALRLAVPLVSNDGIFKNVPGLTVESAPKE